MSMMKDTVSASTGKEIELVDLSMSDDDEENRYTTTLGADKEEMEVKKRIKIDIPEASASSSSDLAPILVPAVQAPEFNLAEVVNSYYASGSSPPILQPEVPVIVNVQGLFGAHSKNPASLEKTSKCVAETERRPQPAHLRVPPDGVLARISNVTSSKQIGITEELITKRTNIINKLKNNNMKTNVKKRTKNPTNTTTTPRKASSTPSQRTRTRKKPERTTLERNAALKQLFDSNPNPTASQIHEIAARTKLTTRDVKRWLYLYKKKAGSNVIVEEREPEPPNNPEENEVPAPANVHIKSIKDPEKRTQSVETIKRDIKNIGKRSLDEITFILQHKWEKKAKRIFELTTKENLTEYQKMIYHEAKRIKDRLCNPLSPKQSELVEKWKKDFIADRGEQRKTVQLEKIKHVVEFAIMPWVAPFLYSKLTLQDGCNLTLEVALLDFCKVSNSGQNWEWKTPPLLQHDDVKESLRISKRNPFPVPV